MGFEKNPHDPIVSHASNDTVVKAEDKKTAVMTLNGA